MSRDARDAGELVFSLAMAKGSRAPVRDPAGGLRTSCHHAKHI